MTMVSLALEERTKRAAMQLEELEGRRVLRREFFPVHLRIIEAAAGASIHGGASFLSNDDELSSSKSSAKPKDAAARLSLTNDVPPPPPRGDGEDIDVEKVKKIFEIFDSNKDGLWCITETNKWMSVTEGQECDLSDWEHTCKEAEVNPMTGLDLETMNEWYRGAGSLERHWTTLDDASGGTGELDPEIGALAERDYARLESLLDVIFRSYDFDEKGYWDAESGAMWLEDFGWFDSWEQCCSVVDADPSKGITRDMLAELYNANEYLLASHVARHYEHIASQRKEDHTFNAEDDEDESSYCVGGYHRVSVADVYNERYEVTRKLGWGNFSTVWLAKDLTGGRPVALKVGKAARSFHDMSEFEVDVLQKTNAHYEKTEIEVLKQCAQRLVRMSDYFEIEGPNGTHPTMALEAVGPDILKLLTAHEFAGASPCIVKTLIKHMVEGLAFLHSMGLAHADIKPENVLIQTLDANGQSDPELTKQLLAGTLRKPDDLTLAEFMDRTYSCKVSDFGSSKWVEEDKTVHHMQTLEYRAPEVVLGYSPDVAIDVWSVACTCYELLTGCFLFNPKAVDGPLPQNVQHVVLFMETLGPLPLSMRTGGGWHCGQYFDENGDFIPGPVPQNEFEEVFIERTGATQEQTRKLMAFLLPMLEYSPSERASALTILQHPWLKVEEDDDVPLTHEGRQRMASFGFSKFSQFARGDDDTDEESVTYEEVDQATAALEAPSPSPFYGAVDSVVSTPPRTKSPAGVRDLLAGLSGSKYSSATVHHDASLSKPGFAMSSSRAAKDFVILDLRQRADYAILRREELVDRRKLRSLFFPTHLEAIKESALARA